MRIASLDMIEMGADQKQLLEWLDFRDFPNDGRRIADDSILRGIFICPRIETPKISRWLITVC